MNGDEKINIKQVYGELTVSNVWGGYADQFQALASFREAILAFAEWRRIWLAQAMQVQVNRSGGKEVWAKIQKISVKLDSSEEIRESVYEWK